MSKPTNRDLMRLKRLVRYLKAHPRAVFEYPFRLPPTHIQVYTDTDWAGCIKTRKSTQGGAIMISGSCVKTWSSTQSLVSLSSAESEYYGIVKGSSVGLGVQAMLRDLGFELGLEVLTDASAAQGIASRRVVAIVCSLSRFSRFSQIAHPKPGDIRCIPIGLSKTRGYPRHFSKTGISGSF